ncbi:multidrug efflux MFS transporter [Massilia forsythiae]|uniref:Multidrug efflux MFS transporter n=1 Tax=Massilia forsythiae TaxID=2728020 RepID=A0A7Z2ZTZ4_9BURK|nr:MDR family MFS transporter [Massilia forsythiae]QJE02111.1 multidrug efflux MFS transporter [Massilia forsythiae]
MSAAAKGASAEAQAPAEGKADAGAWLAVAAGTLGALMATLDISIVNSSLPTIQGEIGASGTEGTWIATGYLVAEIVMIPLSGWLERVLGLRTFLLAVAALFTAFSVLCGLSTTLPMMIAGRVGQGITGGAMIPTAQTIIATRLPRSQQPIGTAMFGATAILGPVVGPLIGGWLTENLSWHYAFFLNVPVCAGLVALLLVGLKHEPPRLALLAEADWLGIFGLAAFLGGLTVVLEEGERVQWFSSSLIIWLTILSMAGFVVLMIGQLTAKRPVIQLRLLLDRQFGSVVVMGITVGMVIYGTSYVIPQFLATISNYNALQAGKIVALGGLPALMMMPLVPLMIKYIDIRLAVGFGLSVLAISAYTETDLSAQASGADFVVSQLIRGVGTIFAMVFLNQAAIQSVSRDHASDAAGLFNAARNLGGSLALAGIAVLQDQRLWLHSRRLEESLNANRGGVQDYLAGQAQALGGMPQALRALQGTLQAQALTMTYTDLFWILSVGIGCVIPLVLFLRPLNTKAPAAGAH